VTRSAKINLGWYGDVQDNWSRYVRIDRERYDDERCSLKRHV